MKPFFLTAAVMLAVLSLDAIQGAVIRAADARKFIGQRVTVEDTVAQVSREPQSGFTYLNFGGPFPNHLFRVVIPMDVEALIPPVLLTPSLVRATGVVTAGQRGIPEILCSDPTQLTAVASGPMRPMGVAAPPVGTLTATPTPAPRTCCRVCTTGKPCGNSCIASTSTCRQPPGCAC